MSQHLVCPELAHGPTAPLVFLNEPTPTDIYALPEHDARPLFALPPWLRRSRSSRGPTSRRPGARPPPERAARTPPRAESPGPRRWPRSSALKTNIFTPFAPTPAKLPCPNTSSARSSPTARPRRSFSSMSRLPRTYTLFPNTTPDRSSLYPLGSGARAAAVARHRAGPERARRPSAPPAHRPAQNLPDLGGGLDHQR